MKKISLFLFCSLGISSACWGADYMSLKYDEVNLRTGPGERFPISWVYQEKNYPLEVLDSFEIWRQVRASDGTIGWVNKNMLTQKRFALIQQETALLESPKEESDTIAILLPGVLAQIKECPKGNYCQLSLNYLEKKYEGWFPRSALWGLDKNEIVD